MLTKLDPAIYESEANEFQALRNIDDEHWLVFNAHLKRRGFRLCTFREVLPVGMSDSYDQMNGGVFLNEPHVGGNKVSTTSQAGMTRENSKIWLKAVPKTGPSQERRVYEHLAEHQSEARNHTVRVLDAIDVQGYTILAQEFGGQTLDRASIYDAQLWYSIALRLVEVLAFLHEHNIAHLDIAARNILYHAQDSKVSLTDFEGSHFTVERMVRGAYSTTEAPEQVYGEPFDGFAFDVYACGRTLLGQEACRPELFDGTEWVLSRIWDTMVEQEPAARPSAATVLQGVRQVLSASAPTASSSQQSPPLAN